MAKVLKRDAHTGRFLRGGVRKTRKKRRRGRRRRKSEIGNRKRKRRYRRSKKQRQNRRRGRKSGRCGIARGLILDVRRRLSKK